MPRRHGFLTPSQRYHRENHCLLADGSTLGKASLRQVSEVEEEEEEEEGADGETVGGEEERVLKTTLPEKEGGGSGTSGHHLAAHSFSVINNLKEKVCRPILHLIVIMIMG